jgi:hypothetical protein
MMRPDHGKRLERQQLGVATGLQKGLSSRSWPRKIGCKVFAVPERLDIAQAVA